MGWVSTLISRRTFRAWGLIAILVVATAAIAGGIAFGNTATCLDPPVTNPPTPKPTLPGSAFEIDTNANLKVDDLFGSTGCIDWLNGSASDSPFRNGVIAKSDTPSGSQDESFTQGTKEDTADPVIEAGSIPPNKSDLKAFGIYTEQEKFLELFWTRVQDPSGTTNMDFELNQKFCGTGAPPSNCSANGVTPVRTGDGNGQLTDDRLITYDLSRGGTRATISIRKWTGTQWGPAVLIADQTDALGTINTSAIDEHFSGFPTNLAGQPINAAGAPVGLSSRLGSLSARTFGEAAISFQALFGGGQCGTFGSAYLKSRSSDSFTAALKDFVPPQKVNISNCPTTLTTTATATAQLPNGQISDQANLGAAVPDGTDGTITFKLYKFPANATINPNSCTADKLVSAYGTNGSSTATVTNHNVPGAGNTTNPYTSASYTPTEPGIYQWTATFTPTPGQGLDPSGEIGCGVAAEQSQVNQATPNITTLLSSGNNGSITVGDSVHDTATLTGATANAGGTVNYTVYSDDQCTNVFDEAGNPVTVTNGNVPDSDPVTFNSVGTFYWQAVYSGDANNEGDTSVCTDEVVTVGRLATDIDTAQSFLPQDSVTLSDEANGTPTGSVTFQLFGPYADANQQDPCSGTDVYSEEVTLDGGSAQTTNGTDNAGPTYSIDSPNAGTYFWKVTYSGDDTHNGGSSCVENSTLLITNGGTVTTD